MPERNNTLLLSFFEDHVSQPRSQQIIARIAPVMPELHIDIIRPCLTELISAVTSFRSTPLHRKRLQQRNGRSHINIVLTRLSTDNDPAGITSANVVLQPESTTRPRQ